MYGNRNFGGQHGGGFSPVKVGEEVDVKVEAVGEKGDGIAKVKGFVLFVPGAKEGDEIRIRVTKVLRNVGFAEAMGAAQGPVETEESEPKEEEAAEEPEEEAAVAESTEEDASDSEDFGEESEDDSKGDDDEPEEEADEPKEEADDEPEEEKEVDEIIEDDTEDDEEKKE